MSLQAKEELVKLTKSLTVALKPAKGFCENTNCTTKTDQLFDAPTYAYVYLGVTTEKDKGRRCKICSKCLRKVETDHKRSKGLVKHGGNLFSMRFEPRTPHDVVTVDLDHHDEDDEKENSICETMSAAESETVPLYSVSHERLDQLVSNMMGSLNVVEQTNKCKQVLATEIDELKSVFADQEEKMNSLADSVEAVLGKYNSIVSSKFKIIEMGTVDLDPKVGSCRIKEAENLNEQLASAGIKRLPGPVADFMKTVSCGNSLSSRIDLDKDVCPKRGLSKEVPLGANSINNGIEVKNSRPVLLKFAPPKANQMVYAMYEDKLSYWLPAKILSVDDSKPETKFTVDISPPPPQALVSRQNLATVRRTLKKNQIAFSKPTKTNLPVGTRVIAKYKDLLSVNPGLNGLFYSGLIAESRSIENKHRYLVFFNDGSCQYSDGQDVIPLVGSSVKVWEDMSDRMKGFVQRYLAEYPVRVFLNPKIGEYCKVELNDIWCKARVIELDCSLMKVRYEKKSNFHYEWLYRGSWRLYAVYIYSNQDPKQQEAASLFPSLVIDQAKSTSKNVAKTNLDEIRVSNELKLDPKSEAIPVDFETAGKTQKISIPRDCPLPRDYVSHSCSSACCLKYEAEKFRTMSPVVVPFYLGWAREISANFTTVAYITPCGLRLTTYDEIHTYNRMAKNEIPVDFFSLESSIDCLNEFKPLRKFQLIRDISFGKEWTPVQCVNSIDYDLPPLIMYTTNRMLSSDVKISEDDGFLSCCDCVDDCKDKAKCACWQLTLSGISFKEKGRSQSGGYEFRRLKSLVESGIYECNHRCKCNVQTCLNRVVQNKVMWPLQVFKTVKKGWGVRALHDIPRGSFLCVYSGKLLNDVEATEEGLAFGDEYIADLDYIESMEAKKEGYEPSCSDIEEQEDENLNVVDVKSNSSLESVQPENSSLSSKPSQSVCKSTSEIRGESSSLSSKFVQSSCKSTAEVEGENNSRSSNSVQSARKSTSGIKGEKSSFPSKSVQSARKSSSGIQAEKNQPISSKMNSNDSSPPSTFAESMKERHDGRALGYRKYFGRYDKVWGKTYSIDGKRFGNFGRYFNHSCSPNLFIQSVFVDTHDLRFPWVAFFTNKDVRAGTELCWDYKYEAGSVPGKTLRCHCGYEKCRIRLL